MHTNASYEIIDKIYLEEIWLLVNLYTDMVQIFTDIVDNNIHRITDTFHVNNFGHLQFIRNFHLVTKLEFRPWKWLVHC